MSCCQCFVAVNAVYVFLFVKVVYVIYVLFLLKLNIHFLLFVKVVSSRTFHFCFFCESCMCHCFCCV